MFQLANSDDEEENEEEEEEEEEEKGEGDHDEHNDLELFQQFNRLKLNFYKKYMKYYENDNLINSSTNTNNNNNNEADDGDGDDENNDEEDDDYVNNEDDHYYDAVSQSSFNTRNSIGNLGKSNNISLDNISSLSQDELKLLELKRNEIEKFKNQEEFLNKKIEELTQNHFNQTELLENQQKIAKYNEKCRNELNELRKLYSDNTNDDFDDSSSSNKIKINSANNGNNANNVDFLDNNSTTNNKLDYLFSNKKLKYSTYTPQTIESQKTHESPSFNYQTSFKSKTWPEKELRISNAFQNDLDDTCDISNGEHDDLVSLSHINKALTSASHRKYSHADSFESALTNFNLNEDNVANAQSKNRLFEDYSNNEENIDNISNLAIAQPIELINPVDKQIMQLKNINPTQTLIENYNSDEAESSSKNTDSVSLDTNGDIRIRKRDNIKKVFHSLGKAVRQVKVRAEEVLNQEKEETESEDDEDYETINESQKIVKHKSARSNKGPYDFDKLRIVQILNSSSSPSNVNSKSIIWTMKFSPCGKFLATAGKDTLIKVWILRSYYKYYRDLIKNYNVPSEGNSNFAANVTVNTSIGLREEQAPFYSKPFIVYHGHSADILDLSWSKNLFLLSASSDKTVRLWHIYKSDCLCCFYHSSIISTISFHPKDDRYFLSACLAGKLRLWNISEKKVIHWNELNNNRENNNFITAICFCQGGKTIAVGTYDGKCILYQTELLKYYSLINVRSTRGRNSKGSKITGIEALHNDENKILITSNDSRIRLYDLRDLSLICKYKGFTNSTMNIKASLSPDDKYIMCASENKWTYLWKTNHHTSLLASATGIRRDRNMYFERIHAHNSIITSCLFSPKPLIILNQIYSNQQQHQQQTTKQQVKKTINSSFGSSSSKADANNCSTGAHCIVSAASDGTIKVFVNKLNI